LAPWTMGSTQSRTGGGTSLDSLCRLLESSSAKNVIVMCGAGISTSAGVPDFRSPSAGLYFKIRKYNLPYPEAVFDGGYFRHDPVPFYSLVRDIYPERLCPTDTHKFFTLLHKKGILRRVYTQNIDALEFLAGLPEDKVVEAHGTFQRSYCTKCHKNFDLPWLKREIFSPESNGGVPKCDLPNCCGVVRPDVVLFGEQLPDRFFRLASEDFPACDLLLVFGTSLAVAPFNHLVTKPARGVPRVFVNRTRPGSTGFVGWVLGMGRSVKFDEPDDLILLGDCDQQVREICDKTGWRRELDSLQVEVMEP